MQDNIVDSHRTTDGRTDGRSCYISHLYLSVHQPCNDVDPRHAVVLCRAVSQDDHQPLCCEAVVGLLERRRAEQAPVAATETLRRRHAEDASSGHLERVEGEGAL